MSLKVNETVRINLVELFPFTVNHFHSRYHFTTLLPHDISQQLVNQCCVVLVEGRVLDFVR